MKHKKTSLGPDPWNSSAWLQSVLLLAPLLLVFSTLFQPAQEWLHVQDYLLLNYFKNTIILVLAVSALALAFALPAAWLTTFFKFPAVNFWTWALICPITIPSYIAGFCYFDCLDQAIPIYIFLRKSGATEQAMQLEQCFRFGLLILLLASVLYPYLFFSLRASFLRQQTVYHEVARISGRGHWATCCQIGLPLARPALFAGLSLITMEVVNDYGAIHFFGVPTLTEGIFHAWFALEDKVSALRIALILMALLLPFFAVEAYFRRGKRYGSHELASTRAQRFQLTGWRAVAAVITCAIPFFFGFLFPVGKLVHWATLSYSDFDLYSFIQQTSASLALALVTTLAIACMALCLAYTTYIRNNQATQAIVRCATLGYLIPGAVIAVGVMLLFGSLDNILKQHLFSGSLLAIAFAYCVRFITVAFQPLRSGLSGSCQLLHEASLMLAQSESQTLWRVHVPTLSPLILAAAVLVFIDITKELPLTLIMRPAGFETLATSAFGYAKEGHLSNCAIPCLAIITVSLAGLCLARKTFKDNLN